MRARNNSFDLKKLLYVSLFVLSFLKGFGLAANSTIYSIAYVFVLFGTLISVISRKSHKKELAVLLIAVGLGFLTFVLSGETTFLFSAILIVAVRELDLRSVMKVLLVSRIVAFVLNITLSLTGIIPFNSFSFYRESVGGYILRYSFGYAHPNLFHSSFTLIVIIFGYLRSARLRLSEVVIVLLANSVVFELSQSRTNFIITVVYCVLALIFRFSRLDIKKTGHVTKLLFLGCILLSFLVAYAYGKIEVVDVINSLLTGRIRYMSQVLTNYGIPIINHGTYEGITFDNGYFDLLYNGGLLIGVLYVILLLKTIKMAVDNKNKDALLLIVINLLFSLTESFFCNALMNPSLLLISGTISNGRSAANNKTRLSTGMGR